MDKSDQPDDTTSQRKLSKALTVLAYPAAALTGFMRANSKINNYVYGSVKNHGALDDLRGSSADHPGGASGVYKEMHELGASAIERNQKGIKVDFPRETAPIHARYNASVKDRMKLLTLDTLPKKWEQLQTHERWDVTMSGLEIGAISLGALLYLSQHNRLAQMFGGDDKAKGRGA